MPSYLIASLPLYKTFFVIISPKSRLAPTPSGYLHFGNAANFVLNARLAQRGDLLLRIDDLDRARYRPEYLEDIFRVISWLGIQPTSGPKDPEDFEQHWSQEHRMPLYHEALDVLRRQDLVFACPCTRKELAAGDHQYGCLQGEVGHDAPGVAWRLNTRELGAVFIPDMVRPGGFKVDLHQEIPDFVVRTKSRRPSYQVACTVDDLHFGVNRVGRGQDLLPSTAAQAVLSDLLRYPGLFGRIQFLHHPLLLEKNGQKLSKSAGAMGVSSLFSTTARTVIFRAVDEWLSP